MADGSPDTSRNGSTPAANGPNLYAQVLAERQQPITQPPTGPIEDIPTLWLAKARRGQTVPTGSNIMPNLRQAILTVQMGQDYSSTTAGLVKALERAFPDLWPANTPLAQKERDVANAYHMQPSATGGLPFPPMVNETDKRKWIEDQLDGKNPGQGQGFALSMTESRRQQLVGALLGRNGTGKALDWEQVMASDAPPQPISKARAHEVAGMLMTRRASRLPVTLQRADLQLSANAALDLVEGSDAEQEVIACLDKYGPMSDQDLCRIIAAICARHLEGKGDNDSGMSADNNQPPRIKEEYPSYAQINMSQPTGANVAMALSVTPAGSEMSEARRRHLVAEQTRRLARPINYDPVNFRRGCRR
jgi:hypothetical protein